MNRREFLAALGVAAAGTQIGCASAGVGSAPARLRQILDRNGLSAPSTHVEPAIFDNLAPQIEAANILGHRYLIVASLPDADHLGLDDYRRWADRFNEAGARALRSNIRIGFHDEAWDFRKMSGTTPYDVFVERVDPAVVALQFDTGNAAVGGADPLEYMKRYGSRYSLFHIKDAPSLGADHDVELGKGIIDFRRLLGMIDHIDDKHLYVEQESYPGAPLDSVKRDYAYISQLQF